MTCRRKTKTDREIIADINKRLKEICSNSTNCKECILGAFDEANCVQAYITYLTTNIHEGTH